MGHPRFYGRARADKYRGLRLLQGAFGFAQDRLLRCAADGVRRFGRDDVLCFAIAVKRLRGRGSFRLRRKTVALARDTPPCHGETVARMGHPVRCSTKMGHPVRLGVGSLPSHPCAVRLRMNGAPGSCCPRAIASSDGEAYSSAALRNDKQGRRVCSQIPLGGWWGWGAAGSGIIEMFYVGRGVCLGWKLRAPIVTDLMTGLARMAYLRWPN
jgi:hypothetical protein